MLKASRGGLRMRMSYSTACYVITATLVGDGVDAEE